MNRIVTRTQLVEFICKRSGRSAIKRACYETGGKVVVLGGFKPLLPYDYPGWIVTITSRFDRTWYAVVLGNSDTYDYDLHIHSKFRIPWKNYIGRFYDQDRTCLYSIYDGDNPIEADGRRHLALQQSRDCPAEADPTADTPGEDQAEEPES